MKKKIILILLIIILMAGSFIVGRQVGLNVEDDKTQVITREEEVSSHDIKKTLTSSGEIAAKTTEKLELSTSKYFKAMCVEDDDTVKAGANILEYTNGTYLTADYDLVVVSHDVPETGELCDDDNYIEVSNLDTLAITISINENEISNIAVGQSVEITLSADESKTYTGSITKIDSIGTYAASGTTFSATVEFENDDTVKLGMSVSCTVILQEETAAACVPIDAVSENSDGEEYVVKVNDDGTTEEVVVETGIADDSYVQIVSGLALGEKVQIETELTASDTDSDSSNESGFGNFGGGGDMQEMRGGGDFSGGEMPNGGSMPSGGGMPSGDRGQNSKTE